MDEKQKQIADLKAQIQKAEQELADAKRVLLELTGNEESPTPGLDNTNNPSNNDKVIEGIFNGENMVGPENKIYPVPANYASKSKLVEGDKLKLTINSDGSFLFKQIGPVDRKNLIGELKFENNAYHVEAEGQNYSVLYASVTYHKAKPGDRVVIVVPAVGEPHWSVLESIIHELSAEDKAAAEKIIEEKVAEEMKTPVAEPLVSAEPLTAPQYSEPINNNSELATPLDMQSPAESPVEATAVDTLGIDSLEIRGADNTPIPEAVAPVDTSVPVASPVVAGAVADDSRAQAISEMEI